jgi:hypothetical protein
MSSRLRPPGAGSPGVASATGSGPAEPADFAAAVESLRHAECRPDAIVAEAPAPARAAPHAYACTIDIGEQGTGRLVYLHDPAGQPAWSGRDRLVVFARASVDPAMADDPVLSDVVWTWLADALDAGTAVHAALGGTVTTTASHRYGSLAHVEPQHEVELRCSWTPVAGSGQVRSLGSRARAVQAHLDLAPHLQALVTTLADMCGLPPYTPGVIGLPTI